MSDDDDYDARFTPRKFKVRWSYKDQSGEIEVESTEYSLTDGNDSCDCNKLRDLGEVLTPEKCPELYLIAGEKYPGTNDLIEETGPKCGEQIKYDILEAQ